MREQNRLRLEQVLARYADRQQRPVATEHEEFLRDYERSVADLIEPLMRECAVALRRSGHEPRIVRPEGGPFPAIELELGLAGGSGSSNVVGFGVIRRAGRPFEVQAYLCVNPPAFDLDRFAHPTELRPEVVERILVEAIEHVVACNAP